LIGIDRSAHAVCAVNALFSRIADVSPNGYLSPKIVHGDAFALLGKMSGIDAIVNNPPWGERHSHAPSISAGGVDPAFYFVELSLNALKVGGSFALVLPGQVATGKRAARLRKLLSSSCELVSITTLPTSCFPRATVRALLVLGRKHASGLKAARTLLVNYPLETKGNGTARRAQSRTMRQSALGEGDNPWWRCITLNPTYKLRVPTVNLGSVSIVRSGIAPYKVGKGDPKQTRYVVRHSPYTFESRRPGAVALVRSAQVHTFWCEPTNEYLCLGPHLAETSGQSAAKTRSRVYVREICTRDGRLTASIAERGTVPRYGVFSIDAVGFDPIVISAILNSSVIARYVRSHCDGVFKESFNRIRVGDLRRMPIPSSLAKPNQIARDISKAVSKLMAARRPDTQIRYRAKVENMISKLYGESNDTQ
jgi:Eco57I restriction-modification methylase